MQYLLMDNYKTSLSPRARNAHKGDFGHVLIVGGDYGMGGACCLAGEAALRAGAGLITLATRPEHAVSIVGACPELMCYGIKEPKELNPLLGRATVVAIGPGLGRSAWGTALLTQVLATLLPLVVDADALNELADKPNKRENWILTPHPGEAGRLLQKTTLDIQNDRVQAIRALQERYHGVMVLKGANTLVLNERGVLQVCPAGNPGMATGGMGDVLTGVMAALVAQKFSLADAASLGVLVHAMAGDRAAKAGERGMRASDVLAEIRACLNP